VSAAAEGLGNDAEGLVDLEVTDFAEAGAVLDQGDVDDADGAAAAAEA
jgi:hypothetical protein